MIYAAFSDFSSFDFGVADPGLGKPATKTVAGLSRGRWTAVGEPSLFDARFLRVAGTARKGAGPGGRRTRGRCPGEPWKTKGKFEPNGLIYDRTSGRHTEFFAGDGIAQIGGDGKERIWVSYFDEGVYGIFGVDAGEGDSGNDEGGHRISSAGLNCFDASGALIWQHDQKERFIDDCYALNVVDDAAHFYFYSDFDLGTVSGGFAISYRKINLSFCCSFAISSTRALFIGGYRSSLEAAYLFNVDPAGTVGPQKCRLMSPDGRPLKRGRAVGRGSRLHVITRKDWYSVDLVGGELVLDRCARSAVAV